MIAGEINPFTPAPTAPAVPAPGGAPAVFQPFGAPPAAPTDSVWLAGGRTFKSLQDLDATIRAGQMALPQNGKLAVEKQTVLAPNQRQELHAGRAKRYLTAAVITGIAGTVGGAIFPPLMLAGSVLSTWNGYKAFEEYNLSKNAGLPAAAETTAEGRVLYSGQNLMYQAVDDASMWNVVPGHPFFFKPEVPAATAG